MGSFDVRLLVSEDRLKLFLECIPIAGQELEVPSVARLKELLLKVTPESLLHTDVLQDIAARLPQGSGIARRRIAKGEPPVAGRDGKLVLLVKHRSKDRSGGEQ